VIGPGTNQPPQQTPQGPDSRPGGPLPQEKGIDYPDMPEPAGDDE
jgi:hypothetical protein